MKDKNQIIKISAVVLGLFAVVLSVTYAFINVQLTGSKKQVITAGTLDLELDEDENNLTIADALPMYDEVGMIQDAFTFRLINNVSTPRNYILKLTDITTGDKLPTSVVKYGLTKNGVGEPKLLSTLPDDGTIDSGVIGDKETIEYSLRLWIDSSVTDNSVISGKSLSYRIDVEVSQEIEEVTTPSFVSTLEEKVDTTTTINFAQKSSATNGRGIYKYQEDGVDIYYWRGNVNATENSANHVIFGGYCWEMVRTTKTGGVKMIYDGVPVESNGVQTCSNTGSNSQLSVGDIKFNASSNDNAYVGYMYGLTGVSAELSSPQCIKLNSSGTAAEVGTETSEEECVANKGKWAETAYEATHANVVNSNIKGVIDEWFRTSSLNTEENLSKIEDTVYCNDRRIYTTYGNALGYGKNQTAYMAYNRFYINKTTSTPDLSCSKNDSFTVNSENGNGELTYPVGLLTADEIVLAGGGYSQTNSDYYLYTGSYCWALSPYYFDGSGADGLYVHFNGRLINYYVYYANGARPVVSLLAGTSFASGGEGTESNPYVVQ